MVSVIMPLYNKVKYVEKAIQTILSQSYNDWELIIVDDGSTDGSGELADKLTACDNRCQVIHQQNAGVSTARNNGIIQSRGQYVSFLDADDWWSVDFIETMVLAINTFEKAGIVGSNWVKVQYGRESSFFDGEKDGYKNYFRMYCTPAQPLWTGAIIVKRDVLETVKWKMPDGESVYFKPWMKIGEDFDLWVRIALRYPVAFVNKKIAFYNYDQPLSLRESGKFYEPKHNMLWQVGWLEPEEKVNPDYKAMIDYLRVSGLQHFFLSKEYHQDAVTELNKVDWSKQPDKWRIWYSTPRFLLVIWQNIRKYNSLIKKKVMNCTNV